jgi:hypothetical protein
MKKGFIFYFEDILVIVLCLNAQILESFGLVETPDLNTEKIGSETILNRLI